MRQLKVLDFDCECRPVAWIGGDFVTRGLTAIGWSFVGSGEVHSRVLTHKDRDTKRILEPFLVAYAAADIVQGHYIRGFDFGLVNGALVREGMPLLDAKMSRDTKNDLYTMSSVSKSQENLGALFELNHPKVPMNEPMWAEHNLWQTERSVKWVRERVEGDVVQHIELTQTLVDLGYLTPPRRWAGSGSTVDYVP